ncbi:MAG: exonuclease domain-containing protein [Oligoflexia bacterium]|nr:exonuclease domain-containing protein [Oligoflexia bacterium]
MKYAAILDFETTGMSADTDQVIEGAVALVALEGNRRFGETIETYSSFNDPGVPIPELITRLTGITDAQVTGQKLDWERFNGLLSRAAVLISHNVQFDRDWVEKHGGYRSPWWACSLRMIDWSATHAMPCRTLKHLAWEHDHFPNAHRAIDDVDTLLFLLRQPTRSDPARTYGQELLDNAALKRHLVFATGAPFETKDALKANQFRWAAEKRVWWKLATEPELAGLLSFLRENGCSRPTVSEPVDSLAPDFKARYGL